MRIGILMGIDDAGNYHVRVGDRKWVNIGKSPENVQDQKNAIEELKRAGGKDGEAEFMKFEIINNGPMRGRKGLFDKSLPDQIKRLKKGAAEAEKKNPAPAARVKTVDDMYCSELIPRAERLKIDVLQATRAARKDRVTLRDKLIELVKAAEEKKPAPAAKEEKKKVKE
jgi:hypothetical protein